MATKAQAEHVLNTAQKRLRKLGAHGLSVRPEGKAGTTGPVIRALRVPSAAGPFPKSVSATVDGKRIRIPVEIEEAERFQAEQL